MICNIMDVRVALSACLIDMYKHSTSNDGSVTDPPARNIPYMHLYESISMFVDERCLLALSDVLSAGSILRGIATCTRP